MTSSKPGAFPSALRNKRDDVQSDIKDAAAALVRDDRGQEKWSKKRWSGKEGTKRMLLLGDHSMQLLSFVYFYTTLFTNEIDVCLS